MLKQNKYPHWSNWSHYFKAQKSWCFHHESFLPELTNILPDYINTIINFGCASGRDFIPFNKKYKLVGFDIAPFEEIIWVDKFENLEYHECSIKDFTEYTLNNNLFLDLSKCLIYTQATMMYESKETQELFFLELIKRECKNFIFSEYIISQPHQVPNGCLQLNPDYFDIYCFRKDDGVFEKDNGIQPHAHMALDIPQDKIFSLIK
jgi:hypothetical protein